MSYIRAVTVNHNTSHFVELMLRTLFMLHSAETFRLSVAVLDNASDDEQLPALKKYLDAQNIPFQQTGFDATIAVEKHGLALEAFVQNNADATHFLFLDSDIWFIERDTIRTMFDELNAAGENVFANQARIAGYYADRIIEGRDGIPGAADEYAFVTTFDHREYVATKMTRCSPVCTLVKNTPLFRRLVETIGLTPAQRFQFRAAQYFDTFALMTHVMATHRQNFIVSSKTINHFTQATYMSEHRVPKDNDCMLLLSDLRAGRGMERENFYVSDWVKQQRNKAA